MNKIIAGLVGLGLFGQTYIADCASRKDFSIPNSDEKCLLAEGYVSPEIYIRQFNIDGKILEEAYHSPIPGLRTRKPFSLWFDKNGNGIAEPNEIFISPKMDNDWEKYVKEINL